MPRRLILSQIDVINHGKKRKINMETFRVVQIRSVHNNRFRTIPNNIPSSLSCEKVITKRDISFNMPVQNISSITSHRIEIKWKASNCSIFLIFIDKIL